MKKVINKLSVMSVLALSAFAFSSCGLCPAKAKPACDKAGGHCAKSGLCSSK